MAIDLPIDDDAVMPTFEDLYENFIADKYGTNFFKYALFLNSSVMVFVVCIAMFYLSDKWQRLHRTEIREQQISPIVDFDRALRVRATAARRRRV